jgi:hypothetical protein
MGDHAHKTAFFLLSADDPFDAGENLRDVGEHVAHPALVFIGLLLLGEVPAPSAHFGEADLMAVPDIILETDLFSGTELIQYIAEIRISDRSFRLDDGIVMIQDETAVFRHGAHLRGYYSKGPEIWQPEITCCYNRTNVL